MGKSKQFTLQLGLAPFAIAIVNHIQPYTPQPPQQHCLRDRRVALTDGLSRTHENQKVGVCGEDQLAPASVGVWRRAESGGYVAHTLQIPLQCLQSHCIIQKLAHVGLSLNPKMLLLLLLFFEETLKGPKMAIWTGHWSGTISIGGFIHICCTVA